MYHIPLPLHISDGISYPTSKFRTNGYRCRLVMAHVGDARTSYSMIICFNYGSRARTAAQGRGRHRASPIHRRRARAAFFITVYLFLRRTASTAPRSARAPRLGARFFYWLLLGCLGLPVEHIWLLGE